MLLKRTLLIGTIVLAGFTSVETAQAGFMGHVNHAMRWMGWGYSDGYHSRTQGWSESTSGEWIETPSAQPAVAPDESVPTAPTPATPPPRSTRLPRNILTR